MRSCAKCLSRECRQSGGKLDEAFDADLRLAESHARAVALIEHPGRKLAAKVRSFVRVDTLQILPAAVRRHLQRLPE
jgi:hypothetical protein